MSGHGSTQGSRSSNEHAAPETKVSPSEFLRRLTLALRSQRLAARQFRMRCHLRAGSRRSVRFTTMRTDQVRRLHAAGTITDHRDGVATDYGPGVGWLDGSEHDTLALRTEAVLRWRSRSTSSGKSKFGPGIACNAQVPDSVAGQPFAGIRVTLGSPCAHAAASASRRRWLDRHPTALTSCSAGRRSPAVRANARVRLVRAPNSIPAELQRSRQPTRVTISCHHQARLDGQSRLSATSLRNVRHQRHELGPRRRVAPNVPS